MERSNNPFRKFTGLRLDGKNNNWFIIKESLCLSYSYMSFVIKDKIESGYLHYDFYDVEAYNYIFNGKTAFLDSRIVTDNAK